jgi:hypothetical protein
MMECIRDANGFEGKWCNEEGEELAGQGFLLYEGERMLI